MLSISQIGSSLNDKISRQNVEKVNLCYVPIYNNKQFVDPLSLKK